MSTRACAAILLVVVLVAGCGESSTVDVVNQEPTIRFTFNPLGVPAGFPVDLSVAVSDPNEGDALTVTWAITRGTLTPKNAEKTVMTWAVPITTGSDTVTVSVTDGEATVSTKQVLKVGTLTTGISTYIAADSPYILRANDSPPRVVVDAVVVMEAGVEILVDIKGTIFDVTPGTLNINGTQNNPVIIRANDRSLFCGENRGWWEGIVVGTDITNGKLNMNYGQIWYAVDGVRLRDGGNATITNSTMQCCGTNGVLHEGVGSLVMTNSKVLNSASNGVTVEAITLLPAEITITGCDISINENSGLSLDFNDFSAAVPVTITDNRFQDNFVHGIVMKNWVWPTIEHNSFSFNGGGASNIRLQAPFHNAANVDSLDVSCNYWGGIFPTAASIDNTIRDRLDSATLGTRLIVTPWFNEDPYQATTMPPCDGGL